MWQLMAPRCLSMAASLSLLCADVSLLTQQPSSAHSWVIQMQRREGHKSLQRVANRKHQQCCGKTSSGAHTQVRLQGNIKRSCQISPLHKCIRNVPSKRCPSEELLLALASRLAKLLGWAIFLPVCILLSCAIIVQWVLCQHPFFCCHPPHSPRFTKHQL